ncbi:MAG: hypothetical protein ABF293_11520 [Flavobacteriaceae bacterium]
MSRTIKFLSLIFVVWFISCQQESDSDPLTPDSVFEQDQFQDVDAKSTAKQTVVIFDVVNGVLAGTSTLHRNNNGITANFKATGLIPGHAYTVWWVIWNNPEECEGGVGACGSDADFIENADAIKIEIMYATGHVAGNSGTGNFGAHLNENDDSGSINDLQFLPAYGGLLDSQKAEVHLVLRSHGPAVPGIVNEQIGSYLGGCPTDFPYGFVFTEIPDEVGECGDIYASIHPPE